MESLLSYDEQNEPEDPHGDFLSMVNRQFLIQKEAEDIFKQMSGNSPDVENKKALDDLTDDIYRHLQESQPSVNTESNDGEALFSNPFTNQQCEENTSKEKVQNTQVIIKTEPGLNDIIKTGNKECSTPPDLSPAIGNNSDKESQSLTSTESVERNIEGLYFDRSRYEGTSSSALAYAASVSANTEKLTEKSYPIQRSQSPVLSSSNSGSPVLMQIVQQRLQNAAKRSMPQVEPSKKPRLIAPKGIIDITKKRANSDLSSASPDPEHSQKGIQETTTSPSAAIQANCKNETHKTPVSQSASECDNIGEPTHQSQTNDLPNAQNPGQFSTKMVSILNNSSTVYSSAYSSKVATTITSSSASLQTPSNQGDQLLSGTKQISSSNTVFTMAALPVSQACTSTSKNIPTKPSSTGNNQFPLIPSIQMQTPVSISGQQVPQLAKTVSSVSSPMLSSSNTGCTILQPNLNIPVICSTTLSTAAVKHGPPQKSQGANQNSLLNSGGTLTTPTATVLPSSLNMGQQQLIAVPIKLLSGPNDQSNQGQTTAYALVNVQQSLPVPSTSNTTPLNSSPVVSPLMPSVFNANQAQGMTLLPVQPLALNNQPQQQFVQQSLVNKVPTGIFTTTKTSSTQSSPVSIISQRAIAPKSGKAEVVKSTSPASTVTGVTKITSTAASTVTSVSPSAVSSSAQNLQQGSNNIVQQNQQISTQTSNETSPLLPVKYNFIPNTVATPVLKTPTIVSPFCIGAQPQIFTLVPGGQTATNIIPQQNIVYNGLPYLGLGANASVGGSPAVVSSKVVSSSSLTNLSTTSSLPLLPQVQQPFSQVLTASPGSVNLQLQSPAVPLNTVVTTKS